MESSKLLEAQAKIMTPEQLRLFQIFVGLGPDRTLKKLYDAAWELGIETKQRTIRGWHERQHWAEMAKQTQAQVAGTAIKQMTTELVDMTREDLATIQKAKRRFMERLAIDPDDPELDDKQKEHALRFDLSDYINLVKLERLILGDPTERTEAVINNRMNEAITKDVLDAAVRQIAKDKYGVVLDMKNVTPDVKS
jgi:hypothetical protein